MNRIEEIEARKVQIAQEVETEGADLNALEAEARALNEEVQSIKDAAEKRAAIREAVANGNGVVIETIESEERKMENRTFAVDTVEYRNAFLKNLMGKELDVEERAAMTATAAIPTITMNQIVSKMERSPIIAAVDVTHIPGNVSWPVDSTSNAANWVAMGTAATDAADALSAVNLSAYKLIKTVEITANVEHMSVDAFEYWLVDRLANKIMRAVAAGIAAGSGSNQATGLSSITATGSYTNGGITFGDVMNIIAALPAEYADNASFVMSRATFYGNVLRIDDTADHPIVIADAQAPAKFNILGYPVIIEDSVSTDIYFGDLKEGYKFNFAKDPTVDRDESVAFRTGSVVYRAMALCDGKPTGKGIVRYTEAAASSSAS